MSRVICPFCFQVHDFEVDLECPNKGLPVPARYVTEYEQVAPLWLMTIGFPGHGKTTYLAALTLLLEELSTCLEGMWYRPLDSYSFQAVRHMRDEVDLGRTVGKTPKGGTRPLLFHVHGLPGFESRCPVLYDIPGESYDAFDAISTQAPAMKQVNTAWFLVSLRDLEQQGEGRTLTDLFHVYLAGMDALRVDVTSWNLIVVYTKADQETLSPEIKGYLQEDPVRRLMTQHQGALPEERPELDFDAYLDDLRQVSDELEEYTRRHVRGGAGFVNMVRASGMNLVFSLTSALGQSPERDDGGLRQEPRSFRVLDPFLWALTLERPLTLRTFHLVVDSKVESARRPQAVWTRLWNRLADHGEVTTHVLGRREVLAPPGRRPEALPEETREAPRPALLGPTLDARPAADLWLVLTGRSILDLQDFMSSAWRRRLLLIHLGDGEAQGWPHAISSGDGQDAAAWVDRLLTLE